ncbi:CocE/NonD family hydrolase [Erythrobacter aurantius]|uniref:CocE/NonD family hydrolase n=1 Tax=Erythrobacter aurantius TaxID=2909249 RepID=UPI00207AAC78|nr:CocE/NonD family hydrolase [Erythrobacter aurantius]
MTIHIEPNLRIPLPDGIALGGILFRPRADALPGPVIFTLSPYTADTYFARGVNFAEHGLTFIALDTRGRGNSGGGFDPFRQELADGPEIVRWIAAQPFCNGKVAMAGGSYCGTTQWATASGHPPALATIVPTASAHAGVDFPARGGIGYQYLLQWLAFVNGKALQSTWFAESTFWRELWRKRFEAGVSFRSLAQELGGNWPQIDEWIDRIETHRFDDYMPTDAQLAAIDMPILTITGSYDDDQPGALAYYRRHMALAPAEATAKHHLLIGPWDHAGTRTPQAKVGGVTFGEASVIDMDALHREWFAFVMEGGPRPALLQGRVTYYVMGADCWRHCARLEDATDRHADYWLASAGRAHDLFTAGWMAPDCAPKGPPDSYRHDPGDTTIAAIEMEVDQEDPAEARMVFARNGTQLVYHTAPFAEPVEVTGQFILEAWLAIDTPDTDFVARIYEVDNQGRAILLTSDMLRARHRTGIAAPYLVTDTAPQLYTFAQFFWISRQIAKGSRLRLTIGPNHSIHTQRNFGGGGMVSDETIADALPVIVNLHHDAQHPSRLRVPIGAKEPA